MAGRMELTRPAMMRRSVRKRLARALMTGSLPKAQDLGSMTQADQAPTR